MTAKTRKLVLYATLMIVVIAGTPPVSLFADDDCPRCPQNIDPDPGGDTPYGLYHSGESRLF